MEAGRGRGPQCPAKNARARCAKPSLPPSPAGLPATKVGGWPGRGTTGDHIGGWICSAPCRATPSPLRTRSIPASGTPTPYRALLPSASPTEGERAAEARKGGANNMMTRRDGRSPRQRSPSVALSPAHAALIAPPPPCPGEPP